MVYIDYAMHGQPAVLNSEAAHCAGDQNAFWAFHDLLYQETSEDGLRYTRVQLDGFARQLKLDRSAFSACLDEHKYREYIVAAYGDSGSLGVRVVPTFWVNDRIVEGFVPFADLSPIIDSELTKVNGQ